MHGGFCLYVNVISSYFWPLQVLPVTLRVLAVLSNACLTPDVFLMADLNRGATNAPDPIPPAV